MSDAVRSRQSSTRARGRVVGSSASSAAPARNASESCAAAAPSAPTWRWTLDRLGQHRRRVPVARRAPGGDPALQHELGPHAGELRPPQHRVGELADLERADVPREPVGDRRVDRHLGEMAQHARVVAGPVLGAADAPSSRRRSAARGGRPRRRGPCPASRDDSIAITPRSCSTPSAAIVSRPHALAQRGPVARAAAGREHVDGGDHREVLGLGAGAERHRRRGRRGQHAVAAGEREQVGRVPAAAALDVERVDRPAAERGERVVRPRAPR